MFGKMQKKIKKNKSSKDYEKEGSVRLLHTILVNKKC